MVSSAGNRCFSIAAGHSGIGRASSEQGEPAVRLSGFFEFFEFFEWNRHHAPSSASVRVAARFIATVTIAIVRYALRPVASNSANDPVTLPAFDALAEYLNRNKQQ
jgi:hypothetical protein